MKNIPLQVDQRLIQIQSPNRNRRPNKNAHYEACPPARVPMPKYNFEALKERHAPERRLAMKNVHQQVDQRSIMNSKAPAERHAPEGRLIMKKNVQRVYQCPTLISKP